LEQIKLEAKEETWTYYHSRFILSQASLIANCPSSVDFGVVGITSLPSFQSHSSYLDLIRGFGRVGLGDKLLAILFHVGKHTELVQTM
jgi:hypothetical protein